VAKNRPQSSPHFHFALSFSFCFVCAFLGGFGVNSKCGGQKQVKTIHSFPPIFPIPNCPSIYIFCWLASSRFSTPARWENKTKKWVGCSLFAHQSLIPATCDAPKGEMKNVAINLHGNSIYYIFFGI
jgi:hypothetical protein